MKNCQMPYGTSMFEVEIPSEKIIHDLHGNKATTMPSIPDATVAAMRNPIDSAPLKEKLTKGDKVAVVVSDITRLVKTAEFLPSVIAEINSAGIPDEDITIVIGTGTHRAHTKEEDIIVCGQDIVDRIKIHQHDSRNDNELVFLGTTSRQTPVYIDSVVANADKVVVTGAVSLHPFAGFGGGKKGIMPGVAGIKTINHNHLMALTDEVGGGCEKTTECSITTGNRVHEDMTEVCGMVDPTFLINMVFTPDGDLHEVIAGHWKTAYEKGCDDLLKISGVEINQLADVVIASAGGFPKDINLYQGSKSYMNAVFAVKEGGIMIQVLECPDIKEPASFADWLDKDEILQFEKDVRADFSIPAFVAFKLKTITNHATTFLVTREENFDFVRKTGQTPCKTLEEAWGYAQELLRAQGKEDYTITLMGHASATLPILK